MAELMDTRLHRKAILSAVRHRIFLPATYSDHPKMLFVSAKRCLLVFTLAALLWNPLSLMAVFFQAQRIEDLAISLELSTAFSVAMNILCAFLACSAHRAFARPRARSFLRRMNLVTLRRTHLCSRHCSIQLTKANTTSSRSFRVSIFMAASTLRFRSIVWRIHLPKPQRVTAMAHRRSVRLFKF